MRYDFYFENPAEITKEREEELIDYLARKVYEYRMEAPAIFLAEVSKPMAFVLSSGMHGLAPLLGPFIGFKKVEEMAFLWEKRVNIEKFICRLEEMISREPH